MKSCFITPWGKGSIRIFVCARTCRGWGHLVSRYMELSKFVV